MGSGKLKVKVLLLHSDRLSEADWPLQPLMQPDPPAVQYLRRDCTQPDVHEPHEFCDAIRPVESM